MQDIHKPESLRLRRNLSALINFARFREEKLQPYAEMQEQISDLMEETQKLEASKQELVRTDAPQTSSPNWLKSITSLMNHQDCWSALDDMISQNHKLVAKLFILGLWLFGQALWQNQ